MNATPAPPSSPQTSRGAKRRLFDNLSERTKNEQSRILARKEPLDKLLRSAEKAARQNACYSMAKLLLNLREGGEQCAAECLKSINTARNIEKPSTEASLMLKTRLGLSKSKYEGIEHFTKGVFGIKVLLPWKDIVEHRNNIIPRISIPTWQNGYLMCTVTLRDMVFCDVSRITEMVEVEHKLAARMESTPNDIVNCTLYMSAGVDSATGFSHYNQQNILRKDDSLLTEHSMSLMLVVETGESFWINPNPQSDTFCRAKSMRWQKETDDVTRDIFERFYAEVDEINNNPIDVVTKQGITLRITVSAIFAMVDGKAANAIVMNRNTHACPLCVSADSRVGPSLFHARLNTVEWMIRVSAQKQTNSSLCQAHPIVKQKAREIADQLEDAFKLSVNRPKIGGSGSSNNGNMARRLLADPVKFSKILGISEELANHVRLISSLAVSSKQLNAEKVKELYNKMEELIMTEFDFVKRLPPSVHKYKHLPDLINKLVNLHS